MGQHAPEAVMSKFNTAVSLYLGAFAELKVDLSSIGADGRGKATASDRSFSDRRIEQAINKFWAIIQLSMDAFTGFLEESFDSDYLTLNGVPKEHEGSFIQEADSKVSPLVKEVAATLAHLSSHLSTEEREDAEEIATFIPSEYLIIFNTMLKKGE